MDRLETDPKGSYPLDYPRIYIPVWIDQKLEIAVITLSQLTRFTFQYGQIRN